LSFYPATKKFLLFYKYKKSGNVYLAYNCFSFVSLFSAALFSYDQSYAKQVSCKIFEPLGFTSQIQQLGSTPFKDGTTLAPKLADLLSSWKSSSTPLYTGSGILDPDQHTFCTILICQLDEIHHLETRSHCVNTPFIIQAFLL
jgi:hypothetical protein